MEHGMTNDPIQSHSSFMTVCTSQATEQNLGGLVLVYKLQGCLETQDIVCTSITVN